MDGAYVAIKGFKYQFDRSILEVFNNPSIPVRIEQLQDYEFDNYFVQVKYHDTDYTTPQQKQKIKKPLLQLLDQHKIDKSKKFILFIYLKGVAQNKKKLSISDLDSILGNKKDNYSASEKTSFVQNFTLIHAHDFVTQYNEVIEKIKTLYSKSIEEAELYYSIISSYLLDIVTKNEPSKKNLRTCSKKQLDKLISEGKKIVFKSAFNDVLTAEKRVKLLHSQFFKSQLNKEPNERFFVVEVNNLTHISVIKELVLTLKNKWSKNKTKTIPESDRFVPYILLHGIESQKLIELKTDLQKDGYNICDGYDFFNAPFNLASLKVRPTFENKLFFKFINKASELDQIINQLDRTGEIYQFYLETPLSISFTQKHLKFQVQEVNEIKNII
ncbi:hypothetical protein SAMN05192545_3561 [Maribacter dokdonensis]|uniref:PD-(D/E)XK nuclease superfamily protein n=1 Tax=Maribacter dokdonensis TaxID=320912 RepID=A0ABY0UY87_9FLAO|nr:hypothetical protein [Maribacter dokdonensis]SDT37257.1 hypothetical protein SAMN05192545_3561 [Maribacter dokdonensis]